MDINKILEIIALQNNVWNSNDEEVQAHWRRIPTKHGQPTLEEVLLYIINTLSATE